MNWDWLAGLLEGRGGFRWNGSTYNISVSSRNLALVRKLEDSFGGTVVYRRGKDAIWNVYGDEAKRLMTALYPELTVKRQDEIRDVLVKGGDII